MEASTIMLKPWTYQATTKSKKCCIQMLWKKSLIDLFKCMGNSCAFTTNDGPEMVRHLFAHNPPLNEDSSALSCAYCMISPTSPQLLVNHIREIHEKCRFQCLFCFYRALEAGNVLYHQHFHHSALNNVKHSIVELPSIEIQPRTDYLIEICTSFQSNHNLLTCTTCQTKHASISLFNEHVQKHRIKVIKCPICSVQVLKIDTLNHLNHHRTICHKCLYCNKSFASKDLIHRHLSDYHLLKGMFYALKMQSGDKAYDIFVLENLGFDVPSCRILLATHVAGGVLLTPKMIQNTYNQHKAVNCENPTDLPKIVKVQGGIVFSEDGSILNATDAELITDVEPDKIPIETRNIDGEVSAPSIGLAASGYSKPSNPPVALQLPKTVATNANRASKIIVAAFPKEGARLPKGSTAAKHSVSTPTTSRAAAVPGVRETSAILAVAKNAGIDVGTPGKITSDATKAILPLKRSTVTKNSVSAPTTSRAAAVPGVRETSAILAVAKNAGVDVGTPGKITSDATHSVRAPKLNIQPSASSSNSDSAGKINTKHHVINIKNLESTKIGNTQIKLSRTKIVPTNIIDATNASMIRSIGPIPSIRATETTVTRNTDCGVSASAVGSHVSESTHETGSTSTIVRKAKIISPENIVDGSGSMKQQCNSINVKDFHHTRTSPLTGAHGNQKSTVSRTCVKLTKLEDGSLVLKFPSTSKTAINPLVKVGEHMAQAMSKSTTVQSNNVMSEGHKVKPFATVVPVVDFKTVKNSTKQNSVVHAGPTFIRLAKDEQKKLEAARKCEISRTQTVESNKTIAKNDVAAASTVQLTKALVLPETGCERPLNTQNKKPDDNDSHLKAASIKPIAGAQTVFEHGMKTIKTVVNDLPIWNRYGINLTSLNLKSLQFHWPFLEDRVSKFYDSLTSVVLPDEMRPIDCFVCGVQDCRQSFQSSSSLKTHMTKRHILFRTSVFPCKHCDCVLCGIEAYAAHMTMHYNCRFVCFLCFRNHFMLDKIAEHMKQIHKFRAVMLSFVHPQHVNPLNDFIMVIPADLNHSYLVNHIDRTIESKNNGASVKSNWTPKQADITELYNCGFCKEALGNQLSLKKHLLLCEKRNNDFYPCAHCEMHFRNWSKVLDGIFRHLYFHGENLFECSACKYKHFKASNVNEHAKQHMVYSINVIRESKKLWKCSLCVYQTIFQQSIMEHVQSTHNLPGERYMCSLCCERMLTVSQTEYHCVYQHQGEQVTMIEMYQPQTNQCNQKPQRLSNHGISYQKVSNINAQQLIPRNTEEHVNHTNNNLPNTSEATVDCSTEPLGDESKELETIEHNEAASMPNSRKRKHDSLIDDDSSAHCTLDNDGPKDENHDTILDTVPKAEPIDVQTFDDAEHENREIDLMPVSTAAEEKTVSSDQARDCDDAEGPGTASPEPRAKRQRRASIYSHSTASPTSPRRASRRVAAKSDAYNRWLESIKYCCQSCSKSFESFRDFKNHGLERTVYENNANDMCCVSRGNQRNFWLLSIVRCFYCNEQDTCEALMLHCREKHPANSFVCVDLADSLKCGLCLYRSESGTTRQILKHFQACHEESDIRFDYYEYINESYFEWALSLGRNALFDGPAQKHVMLYICSICNEESLAETSMGTHVAKHVLIFTCPQCPVEFKHLKALYYHYLAIHFGELEESWLARIELNDYDEQLRDVLMVFQNGLVVSKREAQHTSINSIVGLKAGFQRFYSEQLKSLESYKEALLLPICTGNEATETNAELTCKTFIQNQLAHPVVSLGPVSTSISLG